MEQTTGKDRKPIRRKGIAPDLSSMVYGKIPPQAKDLEEAVLGAIMLEKSAFDTVIEILKPECFYVEAHQLIFEAMQGLQTKSLPIDILTVVEELRFREKLDIIGGPYFVTKLTNMVVSSANIEAHARIVLQKFIQRELIRISSQTIADAYEDSTDVFDLLDEAEGRLFEITNNHLKKNFDELPTVLAKTYSRIEELRNKKEDVTGCHSGFPSLDLVTNGWQPTDLIILAARPAVGKTAFALNLARNCAMHPDPTKRRGVGFFSLEMGASQLVQRILSAQSEIPMEKIARGRLEDYEMKQLLTKGLQPLESAPIYIDDSAALNVFELRAKCRRMVNKYGVGMVIIDYLQLMSGSSDKNTNREQEISGISRSLKQLAKELQIPIIALSQLSRAVESRKEGNKMPQLSDLRESGAIEQDADMVMFLYRPEYYGVTENEMGESNRGETHVKIAKHRNGSLETIVLQAQLHIQKFIDMSAVEQTSYKAAMPAGAGGSKFRPLTPDETGADDNAGGGAGLYIQRGSKMNDSNEDFDTGFAENDEDALF
jgi:replicative DNA helicase